MSRSMARRASGGRWFLRGLVGLALLVATAGAARGRQEPTPPAEPPPRGEQDVSEAPPTPATAEEARPPGLPPGLPSRPGAVGSGAGPGRRPAPASTLPLPLGALVPGGPAPPAGAEVAPPGLPPRSGRPLPGGPLNPGAAGPGIDGGGLFRFQTREATVLGGALDPRTGWPFVLLDHFRPKPERLERLWVVQTRSCPQVMGSDPWPCLRVLHFDARGELQERPAAELFAQTIGRPVVIQVQGSLTTADSALAGLLWTHSWLELNRALPPDAVVIAFDWPSQRIYRNDVHDINEKGRRAYVAGFHLARFVQGFPPASRITLLGQSYGGRVVPSALHLLGGGSLNSQDRDPPVRLPMLRPDLHLRGVVLEGASDHHWLNPGERLDRVLHACEAFLNLYNRRDEALCLYPLLVRSGHHKALGRIGLKNRDFRRLGPLAARYEEHDIHDLLGREHSLLDSVANAQIARWMAPYLWAPTPPPAANRPDLFSGEYAEERGRGVMGSLFGAR